ncbi:MAG: hypothetical protein FJY76_01115 [Candidatus Aenigmarchaeota archaeon]|nr:hypothetical protein [Candidatus Aenigmarchaeota archaeon]
MQSREAIVYAWAKSAKRKEPGPFPSSMDTWDREYGWTEADYARHAEISERDVDCLCVGIDAFSLNTGRKVTIAERGKTEGTKTAMVLHASEGRLLDAGEYGIRDTLVSEVILPQFGKTHYHPAMCAVVALAQRGGDVYFLHDSASLYPYSPEGPFVVTGMGYESLPDLKPDSCWESLGAAPSRARRFGKSFEIFVDGERYRVESGAQISKIVKVAEGEQVLDFPGNILDALGFPEGPVLERFPVLGVVSRKLIWDNLQRDCMSHVQYGTSGSEMYVDGDWVFYRHLDFDGEDRRTYEYGGRFSLADYMKAIGDLQRAGRAELKCPEGELAMVLDGKRVNIEFSGVPSPSATPGGASLRGTVRDSCAMDDLSL